MLGAPRHRVHFDPILKVRTRSLYSCHPPCAMPACPAAKDWRDILARLSLSSSFPPTKMSSYSPSPLRLHFLVLDINSKQSLTPLICRPHLVSSIRSQTHQHSVGHMWFFQSNPEHASIPYDTFDFFHPVLNRSTFRRPDKKIKIKMFCLSNPKVVIACATFHSSIRSEVSLCVRLLCWSVGSTKNSGTRHWNSNSPGPDWERKKKSALKAPPEVRETEVERDCPTERSETEKKKNGEKINKRKWAGQFLINTAVLWHWTLHAECQRLAQVHGTTCGTGSWAHKEDGGSARFLIPPTSLRIISSPLPREWFGIVCTDMYWLIGVALWSIPLFLHGCGFD